MHNNALIANTLARTKQLPSSCTRMQNTQVLNYSVLVAGSGCEVQTRTETSTLNGSGSVQLEMVRAKCYTGFSSALATVARSVMQTVQI